MFLTFSEIFVNANIFSKFFVWHNTLFGVSFFKLKIELLNIVDCVSFSQLELKKFNTVLYTSSIWNIVVQIQRDPFLGSRWPLALFVDGKPEILPV